MNETTTLTLTNHDLLVLALAVSGSATAAYIDERLSTAAAEHMLAARLWAYAKQYAASRKHYALGFAITNELTELNATEEYA